MPIDIQDNELGFSELGRIRLGVIAKKMIKGEEITFPQETDYFVLKDAPALVPFYGTEPKSLLAYLPYNTLDRNFRVYYERFRSGGLYCQGDGDVINWAVDPMGGGDVVIRNGVTVIDHKEAAVTGETISRNVGQQAICPGMDRNLYPRCEKCRPRALLSLIIRDPKNAGQIINGRLGFYLISTGSVRNIRDITRCLNTISQIVGAMDRGLAFVPVIVSRVTGTTSTKNKDGNRIQVEKPFLQIELDPVLAQVASSAIAQYAMLPSTENSTQALPEPSYDDYEDIVVAEELDQRAADLLAMKDTLPQQLDDARSIISEIGGNSFDERLFFLEVRNRLGIGRTAPFKFNMSTWGVMVDVMLDHLKGAA